MISCAHVDEIEELAIGLIEDDEVVARMNVHLASCSTCRAAYDDMREERALFTRRAELVTDAPLAASNANALPPFLAPDLFEAADQEDVPRPILARITPAFVAVAACAALFLGVGRLDYVGKNDSSRPSARPSAPTTTMTTTAPHSQPAFGQGGDVLTMDSLMMSTIGGDPGPRDEAFESSCESPASGMRVQIAQRSNSDDEGQSSSSCEPTQTSGPNPDLSDRGLCAIASASRERVTSSTATP